MTEARSPLYKLIEGKLTCSLPEYVAARKGSMSWREIAEQLTRDTGEAINTETVRLWFAGRVTVEVKVS